MIVIGRYNKLSQLKPEYRRLVTSDWFNNSVFDVEIMKEYTVYGLKFSDEVAFFLIDVNDDHPQDSQYPLFMPSFLFDVKDRSIDSRWVLDTSALDFGIAVYHVWPREFVDSPLLYQNMLEPTSDALDTWNQMREKYRQKT